MTIASFEYRNGGWGTNTATFRRERDGYTVSNGFYDPMFIRSPVEAKNAWRHVREFFA